MSDKRTTLLWLLVTMVVYFSLNIGGYDLWPADEPRFAEVSREMIESGDYLVPRVNGKPYKEKPPLLFWSIVLTSFPFGDVTSTSARIPSVVSGVVTVMLCYILALRLYGRRVALWSAIILATGMRFWWQARTVQIDMLLTMCLSVSLLAFWNWHKEQRYRWIILFYLAIAAGVYAKGPPAIVFPILLAVTFYWKQQAQRRRIHLWTGMLIVVILIALWLVPARISASSQTAEVAQASIATNLFRQTIGRMFLGVSKAQPPWFYLKTIPFDLVPWTLFLPWTIPWVWKRRREDERMKFLLSWIIPALIFFSICLGKRAIYILPLFPVFSILISRSLVALIDGEHYLWQKRIALVWGILLLVIGIAPFVLVFTEYSDVATPGVRGFGICALLMSTFTFFHALRGRVRALHLMCAVQFAFLTCLCGLFILPAINPYKSARVLCRPLRELTISGHEYELYSIGFTREEYILYTKHFHKPFLTGLVPIDLPPEMDEMAMAVFQRKNRKAMAKAVEDVPISSFESIGPHEIDALRQALENTVSNLDLEAELLADFQESLNAMVEDFAGELKKPQAVFFFIQDRDWRWFITLHPIFGELQIINNQSVGDRKVILIANEVGSNLLAEMQYKT